MAPWRVPSALTLICSTPLLGVSGVEAAACPPGSCSAKLAGDTADFLQLAGAPKPSRSSGLNEEDLEPQALAEAGAFANRKPEIAPTAELEHVVREATGVRRLCSVREIGAGKGISGGSIWLVQVPKTQREVCHKHEGKNFKFVVKRTPFNGDWTQERDSSIEVEALKLVSGMKGMVAYFGTRRVADARYTFIQAADYDLAHFITRATKDGEREKSFQTRVNLLVQMLHILTQLEEAGIQHHDLKPTNFLLQGQCEAESSQAHRLPMRRGGGCQLMLTDFGAACWRLKDRDFEVPCRRQGAPEWTSPELASIKQKYSEDNPNRGPRPANIYRNDSRVPDKMSVPKNDVWAAGVIAYQLLVGVGRGRLQGLYRIGAEGRGAWNAFLSRKPDLLRHFKLPVPEPWRPLLKGMLQPLAEKRWTMKMAKDAADRIVQGQGIETPRVQEAAALKELFSRADSEDREE